MNLWNDFVTIGGKINLLENRMDYIISGNALHNTIQRLELPAINLETFLLCHADLSVNNIYIDEDYNVMYIINWAFASSIPESMLLAIPELPQYGNKISPELHGPFIDGFIAAMPKLIKERLVNRY
jgi:hypothetical protein